MLAVRGMSLIASVSFCVGIGQWNFFMGEEIMIYQRIGNDFMVISTYSLDNC